MFREDISIYNPTSKKILNSLTMLCLQDPIYMSNINMKRN